MATQESIISLTPIAAEKMQQTMRDKNLDGYGLRVFISGGGCGQSFSAGDRQNSGSGCGHSGRP